MIFEVASFELEGERVRGSMEGSAGADWLLVGPAGEASLDVRATMRTHDGALVYLAYYGRFTTDGTLPVTIYVAPRFETSDERYRWLNHVQAVGKGVVDESLMLTYEWYEARQAHPAHPRRALSFAIAGRRARCARRAGRRPVPAYRRTRRGLKAGSVATTWFGL